MLTLSNIFAAKGATTDWEVFEAVNSGNRSPELSMKLRKVKGVNGAIMGGVLDTV